MRIVIDFDSTILNTSKTLLNWYNKETGSFSPYNPDHSWDFDGLLPDSYKPRAYELFTDPNLYELAEPVVGSIEAIDKMIRDGHRVIVATKHHPLRIPHTEKWIEEYLPKGVEAVYLCSFDKGVLCGDVFIDDRIDCLRSVKENFKMCLCFGDYDWNKSLEEEENIKRTSTWEDVMQQVFMVDWCIKKRKK